MTMLDKDGNRIVFETKKNPEPKITKKTNKTKKSNIIKD